MRHKKLGTQLVFLLILIISVLWIAPLIITVTNSFAPVSSTEEAYIKLSLFPKEATLKQYKQILIETPVYLNMFWNSVWITLSVVCGSIIVSTLGAYGFTMLSFKGKELLFFVYIVVMLLPLQVTLMPNYMVASFLGIKDNYLAIILPAIFNPFGVFVLRQQMKILPQECVEAAKMDGAGHFRIFLHITLPMVRSGIAALIMLLTIEYWNLIDQAIIFIKEMERYPLSVFLARVNESASGLSYATATFYILPVLALLLYGHEYLKDGIGLMGEKGR